MAPSGAASAERSACVWQCENGTHRSGRSPCCLDPRHFARVHRSAIINVRRVQAIHPWFNGHHVVTEYSGQPEHQILQEPNTLLVLTECNPPGLVMCLRLLFGRAASDPTTRSWTALLHRWLQGFRTDSGENCSPRCRWPRLNLPDADIR
ncbi:LytTR family DNA-binding domain-containing protein [Oleiagrimonas sp. C23AA]|uniref:LytTR family DNA-binding domain-containing protein n=1 Tax=Oleiagrimonas sp. C23AA TaxID=2719047 RepID=UPI0031B71B5B